MRTAVSTSQITTPRLVIDTAWAKSSLTRSPAAARDQGMAIRTTHREMGEILATT